MAKHILCAVDGSAQSMRAVKSAAQLAKGLAGKLTVVAVEPYIASGDGVRSLWSAGEAARYLAKASKIAKSSGCADPMLCDLQGMEIAQEVLAYADKNDVDHIVLGATGKGAFSKFVLGSTSADVISKASIPVTIVR